MKKKNLLISSVVLSQTVITAPVVTTLVHAEEQDETLKEGIEISAFQTSVKVLENPTLGDVTPINILEDTYNFTVKRDYDQDVTFIVENKGEEDAHVYYRVVDEYTDIELGFSTANSQTNAFPILANEKQELPFKLFMQNAEAMDYSFKVEAVDAVTNKVVDTATVNVTLEDYNFNLKTKLNSNEQSAIQTLQVINDGDRVPDLTIVADDELKDVVSFAPAVTNAILEEDETLNVAVIPNYELLKEKSYSGNLIAKSGSREIEIPITFDKYEEPLVEVTAEEILAEYRNELQKEEQKVYEEIAQDLQENYDISVDEATMKEFTAEGGFSKTAIAAKDDTYKLEYQIEATQVNSNDIPAEGFSYSEETVEGVVKTAVTFYMSAEEYDEIFGVRSTNDLNEFRSDMSITITSMETLDLALDGTGNIPYLSNIGNINTSVGLVENVLKYNYYNSGSGQSSPELKAYNALLVSNTIANAISFIPNPYVKTASLATGLLTAAAMEYLENKLGEYPGPLEGLSMHLQTLISQCINRRYLSNSLSAPLRGDNINYTGNAYLGIKNFPNSNIYANETIEYYINKQLVKKVEDVSPNQLNFLEFNLNNPGENILYEQKNSHFNRGSYILETDIELFIPVENDSVFTAPSKEEVMEHLVPIAPNYTVSENYFSFDTPYLIDGMQRDLTFSIFNEGLQDGYTPVSVYVNEELVFEEAYNLTKGSKQDITVPVLLTAPNVSVRVVVDEKSQYYEMKENDNSITKEYDVKENDYEGPKVSLITPKESTSMQYITTEIQDPLGIEEVEFKLNGNVVPYQVQNKKYSVILDEELQIGEHVLEVTTKDYGGNQSVFTETLHVLEDNSFDLHFTEEAFEVTEEAPFQLNKVLQLNIGEEKIPYEQYAADLDIQVFKDGSSYYGYSSNKQQGVYYFSSSSNKEEMIDFEVTYKGKTAKAKITVKPEEAKNFKLDEVFENQYVEVEFYGQISGKTQYFNYQYVQPGQSIRLLNRYYTQFKPITLQMKSKNVLAIVPITEEVFQSETLTPVLHGVTLKDFTNNAQISLTEKSSNKTLVAHSSEETLYVTSGEYKASIFENNVLYEYDLTIDQDTEIQKDTENATNYVALKLQIPETLKLVNNFIHINAGQISTKITAENGQFMVPKLENSTVYYNVADSAYTFNLTSSMALQEDIELDIPLNFATNAMLPKTETLAGANLEYYNLQLNTVDNKDTLSSVVDIQTDEEVSYIAKYVNQTDKKQVFEYEFKKYDYNIPTPTVEGDYDLFIYPNMKETYIDFRGSENTPDQEEKPNVEIPTMPTMPTMPTIPTSPAMPLLPTPEPSNPNKPSTPSPSPIEKPEVPEVPTENDDYVLQAVISKEQLQQAKETPIILKNDDIELLVNSSFLKDETGIQITIGIEDEKLILNVLDENGERINYFDHRIQLTVNPKVFGELSNTEKAILRMIDHEYAAVPHVIKNEKLVISPQHSGTYVYKSRDKKMSDIDGLANKPYIDELVKRNIVNGVAENLFAPNNTITRAQFAAMLARALNIEATSQSHFEDVKGKWFEQNVQALYEAGIIKGVTAQSFDPSATLTRTQAALMISRTLQFLNYDTSDVNVTHQYKDQASIRSEAIESVALLHGLNIMTGREDGTFGPKDKLTRSQMAKVIYKIAVELESTK